MTRVTYIDPQRSACLCDVGLPGVVAAVCVDEDGGFDLVLIDQSALGCPEHGHYSTTAPAHERTGPLPAACRARCHPVRFRCGRPTAAGGRCRIPVRSAGAACAWHRTRRKDAR